MLRQMENQQGGGPIVYALVRARVGVAGLRDLSIEEIDAIVSYWHRSGDEHLDYLGIDRSLLGTEDDTRRRYVNAIRTGDPNQPNTAFTITVDGRFAGYTLLNRYAPNVNYSHWHITDAQWRASGVSSSLYPHRIKMYFDVFPITRLIHQTRTRNVGVNRMLDKYVAVAETRDIEKPDGVALPGEFHLRYVLRQDIPKLFEKALKWQ
jgi:hypothetical protein